MVISEVKKERGKTEKQFLKWEVDGSSSCIRDVDFLVSATRQLILIFHHHVGLGSHLTDMRMADVQRFKTRYKAVMCLLTGLTGHHMWNSQRSLSTASC